MTQGQDFHIWPRRKDLKAHMKMRYQENILRSVKNENENWMYEKLQFLRGYWTRQSVCGCRIFDFFNQSLMIAVEVDGSDHDPAKDKESDKRHADMGIRVIRVRNRNEADAREAIRIIREFKTGKRQEPKRQPGMHPLFYAERDQKSKKPSIYGVFVRGEDPYKYFGDWRCVRKYLKNKPSSYGKKFKTVEEYEKWAAEWKAGKHTHLKKSK